MSEAKTVEKVVKPSGLKTWVIIAAIVIPPVGYFLNLIMQGFGAWWNYPLIFPLPFFWNLVILYVLSKFSNKFKLSPQELTLLFVICFITAGGMYAAYGFGYWTTTPLPNWNIGFATSGLNREAYKDVFYKNVPSFIVPKDPAVMRAFWYGGSFDLGAWLVPILFWIVWGIAEFVGMAIWGYFLRKPLVEVERLPFPGIAPHVYLMKYYTQEESGTPVLFNFRLQLTKLFWLGFIVGIILAIPGQVINFWPLAFGGNALTNWPVNLIAITQGPLPGALTAGNLYVTDVFVAQFIPLDALLTAVLYWFVFGVVFQTVAVRAGWAPFTPGAGYEGSYPWSEGPFKWMQFSWIGVSLGLAAVVVIKYRSHIIEIFKKGLAGEKAEDDGVSYQLLAYGAIGTYLLQVALFAITGSPIIMAILIPAFFIFYMYGWTRMMGEVEEFMPSVDTYSYLVFDTGTFLGQWGPRPSPGAFNTILMYYSYGTGVRMSSMAMHHGFKSYKMAQELNTSGRDVLYVTIISLLSTIVAVYFIWPWFMTRFGGYSRINSIAYNDWSLPGIYNWTYGTPPPLTVPEVWSYAILGVIVTYLIYFLRARYTWFFINPIGMLMLPSGWWPTWLVAFIIKYAVLKFGGSRVFEEKWLPIAVGVAIGFGGAILVGTLITFFGTSLPAWLARF
ncbi:MAG: DUF6785 family protein [Thermoproteota archaeon]